MFCFINAKKISCMWQYMFVLWTVANADFEAWIFIILFYSIKYLQFIPVLNIKKKKFTYNLLMNSTTFIIKQ